MDPSPRTPLAPPGAAKTPGPEGDEGASSPRCLDQGLGLAGRRLHGGRPRCGRAVRLHPGRGAGRGLSACGGVSRPRPWAEARVLRPVPRAGNPTQLPGAAHPARPGLGRERRRGKGEGKGWWVRGCGDRRAESPACPRGSRAAAPGSREEPAPCLAGVEPVAEGSPRAVAGLARGGRPELLPPFCFLFSLVCSGGGVGLGCGWAKGFTCGHVCSGPGASKTLSPAPR